MEHLCDSPRPTAGTSNVCTLRSAHTVMCTHCNLHTQATHFLQWQNWKSLLYAGPLQSEEQCRGFDAVHGICSLPGTATRPGCYCHPELAPSTSRARTATFPPALLPKPLPGQTSAWICPTHHLYRPQHRRFGGAELRNAPPRRT